MKTYVVLRRGGLRTAVELQKAAERAAAEGDPLLGEARWICSYVLSELDGSVGSVCVYEAASPEAIRVHAERDGLPVDEIVAVADTVVVRPDPVRASELIEGGTR
jgi:Nickel responsive protein SCO4226-like